MTKQIITITYLKEEIAYQKRRFRAMWGFSAFSKKCVDMGASSLGSEIYQDCILTIEKIRTYEALIEYIRLQRVRNSINKKINK